MSMKRIIPILAAAILSGCATILGPDLPTDNRTIFQTLWEDVNHRYALLDVKGIDWDAVYRVYDPLVTQELTEDQLFTHMSRMFSVLNDKHMRLQSPRRSSNSGDWGTSGDAFSLDVVKAGYLRDARDTPTGMFTWGWLDDEVGYVYLRAFHYGGTGVRAAQAWATEIDLVLEGLQDAGALVFDDRNNLGGLPGNVDIIASRFADTRRAYARIRTKDGPGRDQFSEPVEYFFGPEGTRQYTRPVVLLTNGVTVSGGEWFTLAMRSLPHVVHVGSPTAGAFSLSLERPLPNGWEYSMSVQLVTDMAGVCYEGPGISPEPEHLVRNVADDVAAGKDPQLETALVVARERMGHWP